MHRSDSVDIPGLFHGCFPAYDGLDLLAVLLDQALLNLNQLQSFVGVPIMTYVARFIF